MAYGIQLRGSGGNVELDSTTAAYSQVDLISVAKGASSSKAYPSLVGWTLKSIQIQDFATYNDYTDVVDWSGVDVSITYPSGIPTVAYNSNQSVGGGGTVKLFILGN